MKIFLTGGTGFIGSHFIRRALERGHQVYALRRKGSVTSIPLEKDPQWIEGSMSELDFADLPEFDVFVHFAACGLDPKVASWDECFSVNVTHSLQLWLRAIESGVTRFVICGSCLEYGLSGQHYDFIPTDAPLLPTGPYHASKAAASLAAIAMAKDKKVAVSVLRPFHVYGEGGASIVFGHPLGEQRLLVEILL